MFILNLLTPERKLLYKQEIQEVTVPAFSGELNILPNHAPLVTTLSTGILRWKTAGSEQSHKAVISWGYCEVFPNGVNILADSVDLAEEIDQAVTEADLKIAEAKLGKESLSDEQWENTQREVARLRSDLELLNTKSH